MGTLAHFTVLFVVTAYSSEISHHAGQINTVRDWSLITGRGGATKRDGGGAREVLPLRKGGAKKVLAMLKGGHKKFWGSFYAVA